MKSPQDCEHTEMISFWVKEHAFVSRLSNMFSFKITTFTIFSYITRRKSIMRTEKNAWTQKNFKNNDNV